MWLGKQIKLYTKPDALKLIQVYGQRLIGRRLYISELQQVSLQPRLFTVIFFNKYQHATFIGTGDNQEREINRVK